MVCRSDCPHRQIYRPRLSNGDDLRHSLSAVVGLTVEFQNGHYLTSLGDNINLFVRAQESEGLEEAKHSH
jgi:hypothetical protein